MNNRVVYKIVPRALWAEAERSGTFDGAPVDHTDGYIHLSSTTQVTETANRYFAGLDDLLLVAVPTEPLGKALVWEPSRGGALFPHLYSSLSLKDVLWAKPLLLGPNGSHIFPELEPQT
jgi:uncharacterized protein (DUF952 family)